MLFLELINALELLKVPAPKLYFHEAALIAVMEDILLQYCSDLTLDPS
jgi:hypothetical protein